MSTPQVVLNHPYPTHAMAAVFNALFEAHDRLDQLLGQIDVFRFAYEQMANNGSKDVSAMAELGLGMLERIDAKADEAMGQMQQAEIAWNRIQQQAETQPS